MNYAAYIAHLKERLGEQGFGELALPGDLTDRFGLALERQEPWGRLLLVLAGKVNMTERTEQEALVAAAGAWVRNMPKGAHLILVFPFDRKVKEEESEPIVRLRQDGPERRWSVVPWTADLEVELLDRHTGFPPVDAQVARALTEVPRTKVEELVRRSTGPRVGRPRVLGDMSFVPATRVILATTIAYYLWALLMGGGGLLGGIFGVLAGPNLQTLIRWGANYGALVFYEGQQWRLLSHILLHGGLLHLGLNMWALWRIGQYVEMVYGTGRMLFIYLVAGMAGGIASTAFRPDLVPSVGASGAVLGLLGALIYFGRTFKDRPVNWHGLWGPVAINLLYGFFIPIIDNYAHVGGFIGGMIAGFVAGVPGLRRPWQPWAMGAVGLVLGLLLTGVIPLPHLVSRP
ncbi:MAG: rhomboid family protein [Bacillota bacterium]